MSERGFLHPHVTERARPRLGRAVATGLVLITILTLVACIPPPPPGASFADTFTRAAGPMGSSETGQPWLALEGTWELIGERAAPTSPGYSLTTADTGAARGRVQASVAAPSTEFWLTFLVEDAQDLWRFGRSADGPYGLEQVSGGAPTAVAPAGTTVAPAAGDRLACDFAPGFVTCTVNGAVVVTGAAPADLTATQIGLAAAEVEAVPTVRFDDVSFIPTYAVPNLLVTVSSNPSVNVGEDLTYSISITNEGDGAADPVQLTQALPGMVTSLSATSTQGSCGQTAGTVTCAIGSLAPGASVTATTTARAVAAGVATMAVGVQIGDGTGPSGANASFTTTIIHVGPTIDVWYGPVQPSGTPGTPQRWVDVLGTIRSDHPLTTTTFTVNGGPARPLTLGPTGRRLSDPGDFVAQIPVSDLLVGDNAIVIRSTDSLGHTNTSTVTVQHQTGTLWPTPTTIDWSTATNPIALARVVDGAWRIEGGQLRTDRPGYDRIVAIGDVQWRDYEVTVPITVHAVDLAAPATSGLPLIGFFLRWNGYNGTVTPGSQPKQGWLPDGLGPSPFGAAAIVRWKSASSTPLQLWNHRAKVAKESARTLQLGTTYTFKANVLTLTPNTSRYRFKIWPTGQTEPTAWIEFNAGVTDLQPLSGSLALVAHEADVSFGTVTIRPLP